MRLFTNLAIFIFGASIGSFLNVLIDRLPNNENIDGRSHCDYCKKKIPWYDLFPIVSFFILDGKSRCCKRKLSFQYPLIEAITGMSFLLIFNLQFAFFNKFSFNIFQLLIKFGIVSCLIVIFVSDLKYHLISDYVLITLFIFSCLFHLADFNRLQLILTDFIPAGLVIGLPIFLVYFLSKERAMGLGDVYLSAIIGFLLGFKAGFLALYIAFVTGAIFGVGLIILQRKKIKSKIAFGPFLVLGTMVMLFYGDKVLEIIKKVYGL